MSQPEPYEPTDEQARVAADLRRKSAGWLLVADDAHPARQSALDDIENLGLSTYPLRDLYDQVREKALFLHSMYSAQARAFDDMLTAGGPGDPDAYEAYRQATEFNLALMTSPGDGDGSATDDSR